MAGDGNQLAILVGYGSSGSRITDTLLDRGVSVTVIEKSESRATEARDRGCTTVVGDASDFEVLRQAHLDENDVVAITTDTIDPRVVRAIRSARPQGVILTNLPTGFSDFEKADTTTRMTRRILRMLDQSSPES